MGLARVPVPTHNMSSEGPAGKPIDPALVKEFYENRIIDQRVYEENQRLISEHQSPMITDPAQIGRLTTALSLIEGYILSVKVKGNQIQVHILGTPRYKTFYSEYELIVWLYQAIRDSAKDSIQWFDSHKEAFDGESVRGKKD